MAPLQPSNHCLNPPLHLQVAYTQMLCYILTEIVKGAQNLNFNFQDLLDKEMSFSMNLMTEILAPEHTVADQNEKKKRKTEHQKVRRPTIMSISDAESLGTLRIR